MTGTLYLNVFRVVKFFSRSPLLSLFLSYLLDVTINLLRVFVMKHVYIVRKRTVKMESAFLIYHFISHLSYMPSYIRYILSIRLPTSGLQSLSDKIRK